MLQANRNSKLVPSVLSALIVLGIWSNAIAAVFCPHMMGSSDCCLMKKGKALSHDRVSDSGTSMALDDMHHMQMSDMDMQDMPMDTPDMLADDPIASQPKVDQELLSNNALEVTPNKESTAEAITQPNEPCSHCMMHSPSGASFPVSISGQSTLSHQVEAADAATGTFKDVAPSLAFVDLHDHSPPGSSAPLYVLVSAFRI